jgi:tRNA A37 threonylcarbamoyladenosine dehydratase
MSAEAARFSSLERLVGRDSIAVLASAHVCVVGVGGVGSWTVESLARSGIGRLTLIDMDDICVTNINRQIHALTDSIGKPKIHVLADRIQLINPACEVLPVYEFLTAGNAARLLPPDASYIVDATDRMSVKAAILAQARVLGVAALTIGSAGGKLDPQRVSARDLSTVGKDELLRQVRRKLRKDYGWAKGEGNHYGVKAVVSDEPLRFPWPDGTVRAEPPDESCNLRMDCATGFGAAAHVTGVFGLIAAGEVLCDLIRQGAEIDG